MVSHKPDEASLFKGDRQELYGFQNRGLPSIALVQGCEIDIVISTLQQLRTSFAAEDLRHKTICDYLRAFCQNPYCVALGDDLSNLIEKIERSDLNISSRLNIQTKFSALIKEVMKLRRATAIERIRDIGRSGDILDTEVERFGERVKEAVINIENGNRDPVTPLGN